MTGRGCCRGQPAPGAAGPEPPGACGGNAAVPPPSTSRQFHSNDCLARQLGGLAAFPWISLGGLQGGLMAKPALCRLCSPAACHRFGGREVIVPRSSLLGPFPSLGPSRCALTPIPRPVCLAVFPAGCIPWQHPRELQDSAETKQVHHMCSSAAVCPGSIQASRGSRISDLQGQPRPQDSPVTAVPITSSTGL